MAVGFDVQQGRRLAMKAWGVRSAKACIVSLRPAVGHVGRSGDHPTTPVVGGSPDPAHALITPVVGGSPDPAHALITFNYALRAGEERVAREPLPGGWAHRLPEKGFRATFHSPPR